MTFNYYTQLAQNAQLMLFMNVSRSTGIQHDALHPNFIAYLLAVSQSPILLHPGFTDPNRTCTR